MLRNDVVPRYYAAFREKVLSGEIPVCREISMEMNRIDERCRDPRIYYDPRPVEGYIRSAEAELTKTDGSDLFVLDTFKLWAEQLYGWYIFEDRKVYSPYKNRPGGQMITRRIKSRLIQKQYIIVARGGAKSMYGASIHNHELNDNPKTTHQIAVAPTMKQGDEVLSPLRTAITRARGPLFKFLTLGSPNATAGTGGRPLLMSTKKGIENFLTGSMLEIRPMTISKLQGLRPFVSTIDEWLSVDGREDVVAALEQGASKLDDWMIIAISSEGTVRNGIGDTMKLELQRILSGEYNAPRVSIFYYKLDDVKEVGMPEMWMKAQPNIGITVSYSAYQSDVERAQQAPASRNDILAKRFNLPMEGFTFFFTYEETLRKPYKSYDGLPCTLGADLSQGDDFCSFVFLFPLPNGSFGMTSLNFISQLKYDHLSSAMALKYEEFIQEGSLQVLPGAILDIENDVYPAVIDYIDEHRYEIFGFGYDPYNADEFVKLWVSEHGEFGVDKVRQGVKTETVPLGEIKTLSISADWIFHEAIMEFAMGNAMVVEDTNGNRKLHKRRHEAKIDPVAAAMDAFVAYKRNKEAFN